MNAPELFDRYRDLQNYVGWTENDTVRIAAVADYIGPRVNVLIDDFYAEIQQHPEAARVITGGQGQIERLKASLREWLRESLTGRYDADYVTRRWKIGLRHAEIGLNPAYVSSAMSRVRNGLISIVAEAKQNEPLELRELVQSLNKLLDVELAIIQDAYEAEHLAREKQAVHERSEVKFRLLVEAAGCMVVILRPDHAVAYFSPYSEELTGYSIGEVVGRNFVGTFIPDWAKVDVVAEIDAAAAGRPAHAYETPLVCRDGALRWIVWNAQQLDDFDGQSAVLAVGQDFTERREAQERLLRSERLAAIGQMITGLAHESRNALQRIQSCSEMLELELEGNAEGQRLVSRLQEAQDNLLRLFDEVRGYASPLHLERENCSLHVAWRDAWSQLEAARHGRDATLVEDSDGSEFLIPIDRFRIAQLFRNFFENALAACPDPVVVRLQCHVVPMQHGPVLEVRIRDNGPGLSPEARQNVFEPFFTTKTKGTGLGMAIARRIVEAHGGTLAVGSDWSDGAEFIVTLPRHVP